MHWRLKPYCPKQAFSETRCTRFLYAFRRPLILNCPVKSMPDLRTESDGFAVNSNQKTTRRHSRTNSRKISMLHKHEPQTVKNKFDP